MNENKKLEILTDFPTGKTHVSFSEVRDWKKCSWYHKKYHIDKIRFDDPTPFTTFGTAVHNVCEKYLKTKEMDFSILKETIYEGWKEQDLEEVWNDLPGYVTKYDSSPDTWIEMGKNILNDVPDFLDKKFPGWECVNAEEELYENLNNHPGMSFKGFIDVIIKVPSKDSYKYWILDWKTAGWGWDRRKRQDFLVQAQPILYKSFWSEKMGISSRDIKTGFILLLRDGKNGSRCQLLEVSAGPKLQEKSRKLVDDMITTVNRGKFIKNKFSCAYCDYKDTPHCK